MSQSQDTQFPAGPPQGELAPSGGSDPRSGGAWGPSPTVRDVQSAEYYKATDKQ